MLWFIAISLVPLAISMWAQWRVKSVYSRYLNVLGAGGRTGAQVAVAILQRAGLTNVPVLAQEGMLGDHYDPSNRRLVLSRENYEGRSLSAIGVAAHEAGHALQHQAAYSPLHLRMNAVALTNFASQAVGILPMIGMFTGLLSTRIGLMAMAVGWGIIMAFNLITLPVEFDASRRAKAMLQDMGFVTNSQEAAGVSRVLNAAAMTYVAAFLTSLVYFLWYLLPLLTGGDRRRDDS